MFGSRVPGLSALLRAAAFWAIWVVLCYGLVRVAGPPPPDGLEVGRWLGAGREWFDRLLDASPTALPDNAALRNAFNAAPRAPESGVLLALALWLALSWLALSALLSQGAALALALLGFGRTALAVGRAATFVHAPPALVVGAIVLLALLVLQHAAAGERASPSTAEREPAATVILSPSPIAAVAETRRTSAPQLTVVQPGEHVATPAETPSATPGERSLDAAIARATGAVATPRAGATTEATAMTPPTTSRDRATTDATAVAPAAVTFPASPSPPESTDDEAGWLAAPLLNARAAAGSSPLLLPGSATVSLAILTLLLTRSRVRERLPTRRARRLLRTRSPLPQPERRGSTAEAAGVLRVLQEALAARQIEARAVLVREYDRAGYELLLRCEPGAATRALEVAPDLSWRLGVPIEASTDGDGDFALLRCEAPPPGSAEGARDPSYALVPCGADGDAACYLNLGSVGAVALFGPEWACRALLRDWLPALRATAGPHYQIWVDDPAAALLGFETGGSGPCADLLAHLRDGGGSGRDGVLVVTPSGAAECGAAGDLALDPRRSCQLIVLGETPAPDWPGPVLAYHAGALFGEAGSGASRASSEDALFHDEDDIATEFADSELSLILPDLGASFPLARLVVQRGDCAVPLPVPFPAEDELSSAAPDTPGSFAPAVEPSPAFADGSVAAGVPDLAGAGRSSSEAPVPAGEPPAANEAARAAAAAGVPLAPVAADGAGAAPQDAPAASRPPAGERALEGLVRLYGDRSVLIASARQVGPEIPPEHMPEAIELVEGACVAAAESGSPHLAELRARLADLRSWAAELEGGVPAPHAEPAEGVPAAVAGPVTAGDTVAGEAAADRDPSGSAQEATDAPDAPATAEGAAREIVAAADGAVAAEASAARAPEAKQAAAGAAGAVGGGPQDTTTSPPAGSGATTLPLPFVNEGAPAAAGPAAAQEQGAADGRPERSGPAQPVQLRLLGSVRVLIRTRSGEYDEMQLRPDARDLLTYLLATADRHAGVWPVAELGSQLWPGGKAQLTIRRTSTELSGAITARTNIAIDVVAVGYNGEAVALAPNLYGSDLEQCRALLAAAAAATTSDDAPTALRSWVRAAALIEGVPLAGNSGHWSRELRSQLQRELGEALDQAVAFARKRRETEVMTLLAEGAARLRGEQPRSAA